MIEWLRLPGDAIFIVLGVLPALLAVWYVFRRVKVVNVLE
jgi:hypothetical protein